MSKPFLNWAGKAEQQSFDVPTMPLLVHERLSTKAILEVKGRPDPLEQIKAEAAQRWVAAVNAEGSFGRWGYAIVRDPKETGTVLDAWLPALGRA